MAKIIFDVLLSCSFVAKLNFRLTNPYIAAETMNGICRISRIAIEISGTNPFKIIKCERICNPPVIPKNIMLIFCMLLIVFIDLGIQLINSTIDYTIWSSEKEY